MIDKPQAVKIAKDFLETELEEENWFVEVKPSVRAFVLYGSMAKETNRPDSDIDIMIILPLEQEEKYTKGEYFYGYKEFKINIVLRSMEKLRKIASEKKDIFQKEVFRKSEVLMDTDGEIANLLKEIGEINNYVTDFLGKTITIKIDRPLGSKHPKHGFVYGVNYGFVPNTKAPDGEEIDAYLLGVNEPMEEFTGKCIAIIHRKDDDDDKLVIIPENAKKMSDSEILKAVNFQEKWFDSVIIR
jgi:inorganic pyrophosphatase